MYLDSKKIDFHTFANFNVPPNLFVIVNTLIKFKLYLIIINLKEYKVCRGLMNIRIVKIVWMDYSFTNPIALLLPLLKEESSAFI